MEDLFLLFGLVLIFLGLPIRIGLGHLYGAFVCCFKTLSEESDVSDKRRGALLFCVCVCLGAAAACAAAYLVTDRLILPWQRSGTGLFDLFYSSDLMWTFRFLSVFAAVWLIIDLCGIRKLKLAAKQFIRYVAMDIAVIILCFVPFVTSGFFAGILSLVLLAMHHIRHTQHIWLLRQADLSSAKSGYELTLLNDISECEEKPYYESFAAFSKAEWYFRYGIDPADLVVVLFYFCMLMLL